MVKCDAKPEDVKIATAEISQKFKFFETYRPNDAKKRQFRITPPREGVVKMPTPNSDAEQLEDALDQKSSSSFHDNVLQKTQTTSTMLNKFREMELGKFKGSESKGPRPLKCFTPPPKMGVAFMIISQIVKRMTKRTRRVMMMKAILTKKYWTLI